MRPLRSHISKQSLILMGVPKKFTDTAVKDFKDFGNSELMLVKEFCEDYIENIDSKFKNNQGLFLYGSNGVGKSMLACIILREAYKHRYSCRRVTFSAYISAYTESWSMKNGDRDASIEALYSKYKDVEFLVLEEIGKEIDSKIAKPIMEDLLRYREENGLVTIICSNIKPSVVEEVYGSSVLSLIKGNMTPIKIVNEDKRRESYEKRVLWE